MIFVKRLVNDRTPEPCLIYVGCGHISQYACTMHIYLRNASTLLHGRSSEVTAYLDHLHKTTIIFGPVGGRIRQVSLYTHQ